MVELETGGSRVIPLRPLSSQHDRVWHLVKQAADNGSVDARDTPKVIPEVFLTRLITTKVRTATVVTRSGAARGEGRGKLPPYGCTER